GRMGGRVGDAAAVRGGRPRRDVALDRYVLDRARIGVDPDDHGAAADVVAEEDGAPVCRPRWRSCEVRVGIRRQAVRAAVGDVGDVESIAPGRIICLVVAHPGDLLAIRGPGRRIGVRLAVGYTPRGAAIAVHYIY